MKKSVAAVLSGVLTTLLVAGGCSSSSPAASSAAANSEAAPASSTAASSAAPASGSKEIGIIFNDLNNPVYVSMKETMEAKAKELGYQAVVLNSQDSSETELQNMQNLISKKVAAVCLLPNDSNSAVNTVKAANNANIPVVGFDRTFDTKGECKVVTQIVTDFKESAVEEGKYAVQLLKDISSPKIIIMRGTSGVEVDKLRYDGFIEGIKGSPLEKGIIAEVNGNFDTQAGFSAMQNALQAHPKFDLLFAENDTMALGAMQALEAANRKDIKIIGTDGSTECVQAVAQGKITATYAQQFKLHGTSAIEWAVKAAEGKANDAPPVIKTGTELVTKDNAQGYVFK